MDDVDDSLYLSYSRRNNRPKGVDEAALSPSVASRYREDPHKFYLRKVRGLDEPFSMPLALGVAAHGAQEDFLRRRYQKDRTQKQAVRAAAQTFRDALADNWGQLDNPTIKINTDQPENPRGREEMEISLGEQIDRIQPLLHGLWASIDGLDYKLFEAQRDPQGLEISVGELAKDRGQPHAEIESYDPHSGEYGPMPVAVVGGVPVRGRIDCVGTWPDGRPGIIDHKCVSKVVPYYPVGNSWRSYEPSYNAASDLQLDVYSAGAGIERAGFQFMLRRPQYLPDNNVLHEDWYDERDWRGRGLPGFFVNGEDGLRYVGIWRPTEDDGAQEPYRLEDVRHRAAARLRDVAEHMTESFLLHEDGVSPEIAFPAGDPEDIAKKACPYCHFGPEGIGRCAQPRDDTEASREDYREAIKRREEICQDHPEIVERREHWAEYRRQHNLPERDTTGQ